MPDEPTSPITVVQSTITGELVRTIKQLGIGALGFVLAYVFYTKLETMYNEKDAAQEHHVADLQAEIVTLQQSLKASATAIEMMRNKP